MIRLIGILLTVALVWASVEIYSNGTGGAFGGRLAWLLGDGEAASTAVSDGLSSARRAGTAVERAHQAQQERYEDLVGDD
jgi:hypothetical protein